jgi:hypothetical protein
MTILVADFANRPGADLRHPGAGADNRARRRVHLVYDRGFRAQIAARCADATGVPTNAGWLVAVRRGMGVVAVRYRGGRRLRLACAVDAFTDKAIGPNS